MVLLPTLLILKPLVLLRFVADKRSKIRQKIRCGSEFYAVGRRSQMFVERLKKGSQPLNPLLLFCSSVFPSIILSLAEILKLSWGFLRHTLHALIVPGLLIFE